MVSIGRGLLAIAALLMFFGAYAHAAAFYSRALPFIDSIALPPFFNGSFKALWMADSTTMASLGLLFGWLAFRPRAASPPVIALLALIPAATGVLIYKFLGTFFAGHLLLGTALMVFVAAMLLRRD